MNNTLTAPFVNLNGNSKASLSSDYTKIFLALQETIETLAKSEYDHGRNAIDTDHHNKMRSEKKEIMESLRRFQEKYKDLHSKLD